MLMATVNSLLREMIICVIWKIAILKAFIYHWLHALIATIYQF